MSETHEEGLSALLHETRRFPPPEALAKQANAQPGIYAEADADRLGFWEAQARRLTWAEPWSEVLEWNLPFAKWFVGGRLNVAVNCVDRHVEAGRGERVAFHWEGEPGDTRTITYADLLASVCQAANALTELGVQRRRQGRHLHADDPRGGHRHAGLRPPGGAAHGGLRRLLRRRAARPHPRLRRPLRHHRRRRVPARFRRARSSPPSTRPWPVARRSRTVLVVRRTGQEVDWDDGRDVWWHEVVDRQSTHARGADVRRRAAALHHVHERHDGQAQGHPAHDAAAT